jgi:hypothetical protein
MFTPFVEPGLQVEGWKKTQPSKALRPNGRILRTRNCKGPNRATTKVANPKGKKR